MRRINEDDTPCNTNTSPELLLAVSDKLTRIRFLEQNERQRADALERLTDAARRHPTSHAASLLRRGLYAPERPGELERLRESLGGLV